MRFNIPKFGITTFSKLPLLYFIKAGFFETRLENVAVIDEFMAPVPECIIDYEYPIIRRDFFF